MLDILHELDSRLEPLQIQASTAKDYVRMTEELKESDIALMVHDLTKFLEDLNGIKIEHEELETKEQKHAIEISNVEKAAEELREKLKIIDHTLDSSQEQLVEASTEVERWEGRKALMNEKRTNAEKQLQQLNQSLQQLMAEDEELAQNESEKKLQFEQKQKEVLQLKSEIKQIELSLNSSVVEIEAQIEQSKNKYIDLLNEEATVKNELKHIEQQLTLARSNC